MEISDEDDVIVDDDDDADDADDDWGPATGVYADLDFESLRPLDELLRGHKVVIAAMVDEDWDQVMTLCPAFVDGEKSKGCFDPMGPSAKAEK